MGITQKQRALRRRYVGASDVAAIVGEDPFRNAWDVWAEKVLDLDEDEQTENEAIAIGNYAEDGVLRWGADLLGVKIKRNQWRVHKNGLQSANLDAQIMGKPWVMEAKTTSDNSQWGEPYTNEIPSRVLIQVQQQMACVNAELALIPVLLPVFGRMSLRMYEVARDPMLQEVIECEVAEFWHRYVVEKVEPPDVVPSKRTLQRIRRQPNHRCNVSPKDYDVWCECRDLRLRAEKEEERVKAVLIGSMTKIVNPMAADPDIKLVSAEVGDMGEEMGKELTYFEQSKVSRGTDLKKYEEHCEHCGVGHRVNTYRVLRTRNRTDDGA